MASYRVNNYLKHAVQNFYCIIRDLGTDKIGIERFPGKVEYYPTEFLIPIELSSDHLSLAGFIQHENYFMKSYKNKNLIIAYNTEGKLILRDVDGISIRLNYVHDLQNFYFDTTGEELQINLIGI